MVLRPPPLIDKSKRSTGHVYDGTKDPPSVEGTHVLPRPRSFGGAPYWVTTARVVPSCTGLSETRRGPWCNVTGEPRAPSGPTPIPTHPPPSVNFLGVGFETSRPHGVPTPAQTGSRRVGSGVVPRVWGGYGRVYLPTLPLMTHS